MLSKIMPAAGRSALRAFASTTHLETIGSHQFNDATLKASVSESTYAAFRTSISEGVTLAKKERNEIAKAMASWAHGVGAVGFAHTFYPCRYHDGRANAGGKIDTFLDLDFGSPNTLKPIEGGPDTFNGAKLFFSETDGSSFPNGGARATHTAGAYMSWDKTSPPYVRNGTLHIPSAFVTYNGDALDHKTPLLRSEAAINKEALRLLRHLGDTTAKQVVSNVGCEQEYFLVDREAYNARPDLQMCGRMLFGSISERNQASCEQYFGPPCPRARAYMADITKELMQVGISITVNHNEVAPSQHELSPIFALSNVAADQNMLTMEIMDDVAARHGLKALFAEKPFAGVNGSGKHNNWGLNTDTGKNLYNPGKTEETQTDFIASVAALAYTLNHHGDVLRAGVSCAGNDHRLGAHEAPPAIMSLCTGARMEAHLKQVVEGGPLAGYDPAQMTTMLDFGTNAVEAVPAAMEDRNRTAPFPFCGNRFEFRAVGSSQNIGMPVAFLNTAASSGFAAISDRIESGSSARDAVAQILEENFRVIFNGDGYSAAWPAEAEARGLLNLPTATSALARLANDKNKKLFTDAKVFSEGELEARQDVLLAEVAETLLIEANTAVRMADTGFLPAFSSDLMNYGGSPALEAERKSVYDAAADETRNLKAAIEAFPADGTSLDQASYGSETLRPAMGVLRAAVDAGERLCQGTLAPYPGYEEILFDHQSQAPSRE